MDGEKLKILRETKGYTRAELANKVFVSKAEVQSWEEGWYIKEPSSGEIECLAEAFNLSEDNLCSLLNIDIENGYSEDEPIRFIDFVDSGIRLVKHINGKIK